MSTHTKKISSYSIKTKYLTFTSIMAALITIMTAYICHIPVGTNGGYIHFGDALIYLSATLLPKPYAICAAAIGGGVADLLTAPMWTLPTVIIKSLLVLSFTSKTEKIITKRNIFAAIIAYFISTTGYFIADYILYGTWGVLFISLINNFIQSFGSAVLFVFIGRTMDQANIKKRFF